MKKEIISEIKQMQKLMLYNWAKTETENTKIFEQIIGTPPDASGGSNAGGNTGGNTGGNRQSAPAVQIPSELGNAEGVKKFQDWLDTNKSGWATGYADGKVNKGKGYGRFGPRTSKAWGQYKSEYSTNPNDIDPSLVPDLQNVSTTEPSGVNTTTVSNTTAVDDTLTAVDPTVTDQNQVTQNTTTQPQNSGDITSNI
jgi:hypothetical protein